MVSRYDNRALGINRTAQYQEVLDRKNLTHIQQYFTPYLRHPTAEEMAQIESIPHQWKMGDRLYKLASQYYQDPTAWWVIAWINQIGGGDAGLSIGDIIFIPLPLERVLKLLRV